MPRPSDSPPPPNDPASKPGDAAAELLGSAPTQARPGGDEHATLDAPPGWHRPGGLARQAVSGPPSQPPPVDLTEAPLDEPAFAVRYQQHAILGRGGMGEVRLCRDARIGREVAMKVIAQAGRSLGDARARFLREARLQGQLEHPSVVPVYELGADPDGAAWFTMRRVHGHTLLAILEALAAGDEEAGRRYTRHRLLSAFSNVCLAVDFAHSRGVLHRDLKPGNVMLGDYGEVYVLDWGLAKMVGHAGEGASPVERADGDAPAPAVDSIDGRTVQGAILGTPGYMAPEQIGGAVDRRADVYALGAILFELLSLEPLHEGDTSGQLLGSTRRGAEARPSVRAPEREVPPELEAICVRATALDPAARHASARELHDEIERYLEGDRDLELRRTLAARHALTAEALAARALDGGDHPARARALAELSRALGLEPSHAGAMRTLVRLLMSPPATPPPEARAEIERAEDEQMRFGGRLGALFYAVGWLLFVPAFLLLGMRQWTPGVVALVAALVTAALSLALAQRPRSRARLETAIVVSGSVAIAAMSRCFGPLMMIPAVAVSNTVSFMLSPRRGRHLLHAAIGCLVVAAPLGLEALGVLEPSYRFVGGMLQVVPHMNDMPPTLTLLVLTISALSSIAVPAVFVAHSRRALDDAERKLRVQAWHLRKLVPDEALAGDAQSPGPDVHARTDAR
jgi:serine/threonine-protein kinase